MTAWGRTISSFMNGFYSEAETGLIRLFRTEYGKEYNWMKKNGYEINDSTVKAFLEARK